MAAILPAQAQVRVCGVNMQKSKEFLAVDCTRVSGGMGVRWLFADFGIVVIVAPQPCCDPSWRAIADRTAVNTDNRQHSLAGRRNEGFARGIGFVDRKGSFLKG